MRTVRQRTGHNLPEKRGAARNNYHHRRHHRPRGSRNHPFHRCFNITNLINMAVNIIAIVFLSIEELGQKLGNEVKGALLSTCMITILFPIRSCRFFFSQWNIFSFYSLTHNFFFISCFALQVFLSSLPPSLHMMVCCNHFCCYRLHLTYRFDLAQLLLLKEFNQFSSSCIVPNQIRIF